MTAFQRPEITLSARSAGSAGNCLLGFDMVTPRSVWHREVCSSSQSLAHRNRQSPDRRRTMQAIQMRRFGGPDVLELIERPTPSPGPGQVLVRVRAVGAHLGGYADQVLADASLVVRLPEALSFEVATALMIQGLTALHLTRQIPPAGKTVLVSAAAGGVGSLLVQLARRSGAKTVI